MGHDGNGFAASVEGRGQHASRAGQAGCDSGRCVSVPPRRAASNLAGRAKAHETDYTSFHTRRIVTFSYRLRPGFDLLEQAIVLFN